MFLGEDENAGTSHPVLELVAAGFLILLGLWVAVMSLLLAVPGAVWTAPGLLPFLVSASLVAMAGSLALTARRKLKTAPKFHLMWRISVNDGGRRLLLAGLVFLYVAALDLLSFETLVSLPGMRITVGSFEPVTVVALTVLLRLFWTRRLSDCLAVALGWTAFLSLAFRSLFLTPLPS